ncbi:MAG: ABC transporter permease, partial [Vicinamibacterales bacterium]
ALFVVNLETRDGQGRSWSYPNYRDVRDRARLVDFAIQDDLAMSIAEAGQAERAYGGLVSGNYFQTMGVAPGLGRLIGPEDDRLAGGHSVAVISHAYWQRRFAGDPSIVGREVTINSTPMTIIGVAAAGFLGSFLGVDTAAWVPMAMQAEMMGSSRLEARGSGWMQAYVRLHDGVSREQAQAELSTIVSQLGEEYREANANLQVRVVRAWEAQFGASSALAPILAVLSVVVALVLLIACANVANLLLSRAVGRRREVAVRLSLGASRGRLIRQLLTEAMLLAVVAGAVGMVTAYWTSGVLMAFAPPTDIPLDFGLRIDVQTFAYAAVVSLATGLFFGLAPAWQASRPDTVHALKEEAGRGTSGGRTGHRLRNGLIVAQVAVCLVLLIGATLFTRSLQAAQDISPGFDPKNLLIASVDLFPNGYTADTGRQFHRRVTEAASTLPGVESVALARYVPLGLGGSSSMGASISGYT